MAVGLQWQGDGLSILQSDGAWVSCQRFDRQQSMTTVCERRKLILKIRWHLTLQVEVLMKFLEFHFRSRSRERSFKSARKLFDSSSHHMLAYVTQPTRCRGCVKNHTTCECEKKRCDSARQSSARLSISIYYDSTPKILFHSSRGRKHRCHSSARERIWAKIHWFTCYISLDFISYTFTQRRPQVFVRRTQSRTEIQVSKIESFSKFSLSASIFLQPHQHHRHCFRGFFFRSSTSSWGKKSEWSSKIKLLNGNEKSSGNERRNAAAELRHRSHTLMLRIYGRLLA